jgi:predicted dehydrogenase
MIGIGIIGAGYWGPMHVRVFSELSQTRVVALSDLDVMRLLAVKQRYSGIRTTTNYHELLQSSDVDAVVVATPVSTHADIARASLLADKHVLVEKPITASSKDAEDLIELARARERVLMVGHTFVYHSAVWALRDIVQSGQLGRVY